MRPLALLFALAFALPLSPRIASAQTAVLVDRETMMKRIDSFQQQVGALQQQVFALSPPPGSAQVNTAYQLQYGLQQLLQQMKELHRDLKTLPPFAGNPNLTVDISAGGGGSGPGGDRTVYVLPPPPPPREPVRLPSFTREARGVPREAGRPIDEETLSSVVGAIGEQAFAEDKLRIVEEAAGTHWFRVGQLERILPLFDFSESKLRALELIAPRLVDRQNAFKVYGLFTFSKDKDRARKILEAGRPPSF